MRKKKPKIEENEEDVVESKGKTPHTFTCECGNKITTQNYRTYFEQVGGKREWIAETEEICPKCGT